MSEKQLEAPYLRDPSDTEEYIRTALLPPPQIPDKRVAEIRELQTWRRTHADKFQMNALHAACADIDYLLSLLQQPAPTSNTAERLWSALHPSEQPASERCGECAECHHDGEGDEY